MSTPLVTIDDIRKAAAGMLGVAVRTPLVEMQIADQARIHRLTESAVLETIMLTHHAVKRLVEPEEVAALVGWLVGPDAAMVTGASYTMDGGWTAQ